MKKILGIILLIMFFAGVYFYYNYNVENSVGNNRSSTSPTFSPEEVVTMYTRATLGTIPGSLIDYDLAKTLLNSKMKAQWLDDSFVPLSYGIQQGPDSVEIVSSSAQELSADVTVHAYYGTEPLLMWVFDLVKVGDDWKIAGIKNDEPN